MKRYLLSRRMLANLGVLVLLGVWFVTLAPTAFHGPAAYIEVSGHSMDGTYKTGDLILTRKHETYEKGDIVAFKVHFTGGDGQVIHRITGGNGSTGYTTQGDNNPDPDPWHPTDADVVGTAWHRFEGKAWVMHLPRRPWFAGATAGLLTLVVLGLDARPRRKQALVEAPRPVPALVPAGAVEPASDVEVAAPRVPVQRLDSTPGAVPVPAQRSSRLRPPSRSRRQPADEPADLGEGRP